jgi:hypothetical protein
MSREAWHLLAVLVIKVDKTGGKNEIKKYAFTIDSTVSGGFTPGPGAFVFLDPKQDTGNIPG